MKQLEAISDTTNKSRIGLLGLGLMGTAICERLIAHGYDVHVWNRTRERAEPLVARGAHWSDNPIAACERVIVSLYTSDVVAEVIERLQSGLHPGLILIDTTTGDAEACIEMANRLAAQGVMYLDAPISGSSEQTRQGEATVMVSGEPTAIEACADLWPVLGQRVFAVGASGSAAKMKLVSNLVLGLNRVALAEGLAFAEAIGVDPGAALEVLKASAAYSRVMDVKGRKMLDGDFRPQAKLSQHLKDVRLILRAASAAGLALPLSQTHCELLELAESAGSGELDNCSIIRLYQSPGKG